MTMVIIEIIRVTRKLKFGKEILIEPDKPENVYWGYETITSDSNLSESITMMKQKPDLVIGTIQYQSSSTCCYFIWWPIFWN